MSHTTAASQVRRLVLVPAGDTTPSRGDELVRRYRLARLRLAGREAIDTARGSDPLARGSSHSARPGV